MTDEQRIAELLRAANPVPHHREAMRVVRETDPLWQSIQARLDQQSDTAEDRDAVIRIPETSGAKGEAMSATREARTRRWWTALAAAAAVLVLVVVAITAAFQDGGEGPADVVETPQPDSPEAQAQYPDFVVPPEQIGAVVGGELAPPSVRKPWHPPAPEACTSQEVLDAEEFGYRLVTAEGHPTAQVRVWRFPDESAALQSTREVLDDIQDCDKWPTGLGQHDRGADWERENLYSVDGPGRIFVLAVVSSERWCWIWAHNDTYLVNTLLDEDPTLAQCEEVARLSAERLQ